MDKVGIAVQEYPGGESMDSSPGQERAGKSPKIGIHWKNGNIPSQVIFGNASLPVPTGFSLIYLQIPLGRDLNSRGQSWGENSREWFGIWGMLTLQKVLPPETGSGARIPGSCQGFQRFWVDFGGFRGSASWPSRSLGFLLFSRLKQKGIKGIFRINPNPG